MKVALLRCSGSLNLGNEFINAGGEYLLRKAFPEAEFYFFEVFDSCLPYAYQYPSKPFTTSSISFINACDLAVFFAGSALSRYCEPMLTSLTQLRPPKVMMGASMYAYDDYEEALCRRLASCFDLICPRDSITHSALGEGANILPGLDLGFFSGEGQNFPCEPGGYALVNIDLIKDNRETISDNYTHLMNKYGQCYIIENTTTRYTDVEGYVYLGYWESLYNIIANAEYVVTNRIHTTVVCLAHGVAFRYVGDDQGGIKGRNTLFNEIDFTLRHHVTYNREELLPTRGRIKEKKSRFSQEACDRLRLLFNT